MADKYESTKKRFKCSFCGGDGYITPWETTGKSDTAHDYLSVEDCSACGGKGSMIVEVRDYRKVSKKKKLIVPGEY
jgi:hypothetical protein